MLHPRSAVGSWRALRFAAALPLVMSCTDRAATDPWLSAGDSVKDRDAVAQPIFVVEPTIMSVPTYDGSNQAVHPDVVAFDTAWHGAKYWMTMTPYPKSNQTLENPSILMSNDGLTLSVPTGLKNPIIAPPRRAKDYNSDPDLVYEAQSDRLVLFYRLVDKNANTVHVSASKDGVHWTAVHPPFWERSHQVVSPTVAPRRDAPARMWYVNAGKKGCDAKSTRVVMRTATDKTGGVVSTQWAAPVATDLSIPGYEIWHIKARWVPEKSAYLMLISAYPDNGNGCKTDDLFLAKSLDGTHWTVYQEPVIRHEDRPWTAAAVYRSSFLYDAESDELSLWISARGSDGAWRLGYARVRYESLQAALENGQRISPRPALLFSPPAAQSGEQP
jgi:hypothetical protein